MDSSRFMLTAILRLGCLVVLGVAMLMLVNPLEARNAGQLPLAYGYSFNAGDKPHHFASALEMEEAQRREHITFTNISPQDNTTAAEQDTVPHPQGVMIRSLILPGWGQYTNRQPWKIPIVYGLIGGLIYYTYYADTRYRGYRAAFYNTFEDDFQFGPTPPWIDPGASPDFLRNNRNFFRNRRDFLIIATVLAYGLNAIDAYVFAHMRDFDVSDDLSQRGLSVGSSTFVTAETGPVPMFSLNFRF